MLQAFDKVVQVQKKLAVLEEKIKAMKARRAVEHSLVELSSWTHGASRPRILAKRRSLDLDAFLSIVSLQAREP